MPIRYSIPKKQETKKAITCEVTDIKSGATLKKITAANTYRTMGASACWYSSNASEIISTPHTLSNANKDILIMERDTYIDLKFTADSSGSNGQGIYVPSGFEEV